MQCNHQPKEEALVSSCILSHKLYIIRSSETDSLEEQSDSTKLFSYFTLAGEADY